MVGNPLHAEVTADAGDYVSSMQAAINRTDELDQQSGQAARAVDNLGDNATTTSGKLNAFSASAVGATTATRTLSTATAASLVPALATLSATAVPLTATLGGLSTAAFGVAGGFAAVVGSGLYAYGNQVASSTEEAEGAMEGLSHALEPVREQLHETGMELGEQFVPLIRDTIDALPAFIRNVADAIGPLQPFADALRDAGQVLFDLVPEIVAFGMNMARNALPAVRDLGGYLADNAIPIMQGMADTTATVVELFQGVPGAVASAIPKINEFGTQVLTNVVPAARDAAGALSDLTARFNDLPEGTQNIAIGGSLAAPAALGVITQLTKINPILGGIAAGVAGLGAAFATNFMGMRDHVTGFVETARPMFEDFLSTATETASGLAAAFNDAFGSVDTSTLSGKIEGVFAGIGAVVERGMRQFSRALVGTGGSGGIVASVDRAVTNAQRWLQANGPGLITKGMKELGAAAVSASQSLMHILVGPDGGSGVLTEMVDQGVTYISKTAPKLFGGAMQAIGAGIRQGIIDMTNPLRGKKSVFWDLHKDAANWLINNIPQLMAGVGEALVDSIINGVTGLFKGLVGNSVLKDGIASAGDWLINNMGKVLGDVGGAVVDAVVDGITGLVGEGSKAVNSIVGAAKSLVNAFIEAINKFLPNTIGFTIPEIDTPLGSVGGDRVQASLPNNPVPKVKTGGRVMSGGLAEIHEGEHVVNAAEVDRAADSPAGGPTELVVRFEGEGSLVDVVREEAEVVVDRRNKSQRDRVRRLGERA